MHTLYNSESFVVVSFEGIVDEEGPVARLSRGGFEIVDKAAGKEIFLEGALADEFQQGVRALVAERQHEDPAHLNALIDEFLAGYTVLAQHPVRLH